MFTHIHLIIITAHSLIWVLYFFLFLIVLVFISVLIFSLFKRRLEKKKKLWQENVSNIISHAIFFENDGVDTLEIKTEDEHFLKNKTFRQYFINELIHAKKNLSGGSLTNLVNLYEKLEFDKDSLEKIHNTKWHIKAKGIQEMALMEQVKYVKQIFRLTNDNNELVRNEAQCALVAFYGFKGLRFLNVIVHSISQWQQIQLLNYVHDLQADDTKYLKRWLTSKNNSVVTFALRLASLFNCREVYNEVIQCLQNPDKQIKLNALVYLKKINSDDTAEEILKCYASSDKAVQLNILSVLQETGNENQITFLLKQLHNADHTIKLAAAKTLSCIHPSGPAFFQTHLFADEYPWNAIFSQIENERAA